MRAAEQRLSQALDACRRAAEEVERRADAVRLAEADFLASRRNLLESMELRRSFSRLREAMLHGQHLHHAALTQANELAKARAAHAAREQDVAAAQQAVWSARRAHEKAVHQEEQQRAAARGGRSLREDAELQEFVEAGALRAGRSKDG